jgi:hypothetical protein
MKTLVLVFALPVFAQSQAFEAISIKPARAGDPRHMRLRVLPNGDLNATGVPVLMLLGYAYDVPLNPSPRLSGLPGCARRTTSRRKRLPTRFPQVFRRAKSDAEFRE